MIYPKEFRLDGELWDVDYTMNVGSKNNRNQFIQRIYNKYVNIRLIVGGNKCQKMSLTQVKSKLEDETQLATVMNVMNYTQKDVALVMFIAENEIPFIK